MKYQWKIASCDKGGTSALADQEINLRQSVSDADPTLWLGRTGSVNGFSYMADSFIASDMSYKTTIRDHPHSRRASS
jgi:hypothetical protein